ncbi:MAG: hypothetical protein K2M12_08370, partial [Muribaculaceae bacterium]|nr:hypothetical protein [Muribaculaceae bacterium]
RTWVSCTVNYFSYLSGLGSNTDPDDRLFLVMLPSHGTQLTQGNLDSALSGGQNGMYIRCVRDVNN